MGRLDPRVWPIRWRITALNVGVLATTLLVVGGVFLFVLENALIGITADHLRDQARPLLQPLARPAGSSERGRGPAAQPFTLSRAAGFIVRRLSGPDTGVFVYDPSGALIAATE